MIIPRFEMLHAGDHCVFACNLKASKDSEDSPAMILAMLDRLQNPSRSGYRNKIHLGERCDEPARAAWISRLNELIPQLKTGSVEKVVLARRSGWKIADRLNAFELMQPLRATMPNCFCFCFQADEDHAFFGASPERLYKREEGDFWTEALAGTRPRGDSPQEDTALGEALLNSKKDFKEHQFVVSAIQNVLQRICSDVEGDSGASLLSFKGGHHLLSQFKGRLRPGVSDADILAALHPTPAVGGHPAEAALTQIRKCEPFARGWYAAPVGYIGADTAEFAVAIRSGLIAGERLFLFAGAGIVGDSHPEEEWNEIEEKMNSLLKALSL
jgi:menaquinone-specific isochorismate synthase